MVLKDVVRLPDWQIQSWMFIQTRNLDYKSTSVICVNSNPSSSFNHYCQTNVFRTIWKRAPGCSNHIAKISKLFNCMRCLISSNFFGRDRTFREHVLKPFFWSENPKWFEVLSEEDMCETVDMIWYDIW